MASNLDYRKVAEQTPTNTESNVSFVASSNAIWSTNIGKHRKTEMG